jgi:hypothetical protein
MKVEITPPARPDITITLTMDEAERLRSLMNHIEGDAKLWNALGDAGVGKDEHTESLLMGQINATMSIVDGDYAR